MKISIDQWTGVNLVLYQFFLKLPKVNRINVKFFKKNYFVSKLLLIEGKYVFINMVFF